MNGNGSIKSTHIGHSMVNFGVVNRLQRTWLAVINAYFVTAAPILGPNVVRNIQWTKPHGAWREGAKYTTKGNNMRTEYIIAIRSIMIINLHIHETLFEVLARQNKVQFHVFRGINVVLGQDFVADIVDSQAVKA